MSENNYEPGKGMHHEDLNALTEYWHRETNYINDNVDSSFKSAQNDAYARGYRRGRDDLIMVRKQRDELLAALENAVSVAKTAHECWDNDQDMKVGKYLIALSGGLPGYDKRTDEIHAAIASGKGD